MSTLTSGIAMRKLLYFSLTVYCIFYALESPLRYALSLAHADAGIFARDALLAAPLAAIFIRQVLQKKLHPAFIVFFSVVALHGGVMLLNTRSGAAVLYSAKMLMGMLAGAVACDYFLAPGRRLLAFFLALWAVSAAGIAVDKYSVDFPWTGMQTHIGDMQVDINRDWQVTGEDKRAGGLMRSSINAAIFMPLMAFVLFFHCRNGALKAFVALGTFLALGWTTQKGALVAYGVTCMCMALPPPWRLRLLRGGFLAFMLLMVMLPLALPGLHMPHIEMLRSFNQRVDETWPEGWRWIARQQIFPFGIGLGGLGGAQRVWSPDGYTAGDNLFVFLYASFGLMAFVFTGWLAVTAMRMRSHGNPPDAQAMAALMFLMGYGCVVSLIEDQMALLFLGASAAWAARRANAQKHAPRAKTAKRSSHTPFAVPCHCHNATAG